QNLVVSVLGVPQRGQYIQPLLLSSGIEICRRGDAGIFDLEALGLQRLFQSRQQQQYVVLIAADPHQSDPPDLAFEYPETAADLEIELFEQAAAHANVIDPVGNSDRIEGP